ncbi:polysaccharide deacetylase family protein [Empedobacter brevis]|uniref:polysaccharide deacetylase family protein n=1 Tax=Empedobacter brevis TaxID=247 RepID=UPI0039AEE113
MFLINKHLKSVLAIGTLFFVFSCKNENNSVQNQSTTTEPKEILQNNTDSIYNVKIDSSTLHQNTNLPAEKQNAIDSTKQYVYLTFDDGPYKGSKNINKILTEENVKGTVFLVGFNAFTKDLKQNVENYKANPNVEIANHTFSHARNKYKAFYNAPPENVYEDIRKNEVALDIHSRWVRLPARNTWRVNEHKKDDPVKNAIPAANLIAKNQYYIYGWDYEWERSGKKSPNHELSSPEKIYEGILHRLDQNKTFQKNHLVILMHDDMFNEDFNAEKLRKLIVLLKQNPKIVIEGISGYPTRIS